MSWFLFALACFVSWGTADIFYKKSSNENDKDSHFKIAVWVGLVMGICSIAVLIYKFGNLTSSGEYMNFSDGLSYIVTSAATYLPASLPYILSMIIGYVGLRYLELSIVSPVQNASGAFSMIAMILFFSAGSGFDGVMNNFSAFDIVGTSIITIAIIALAFVERKISINEICINENQNKAAKKFRLGAKALLFPILYCVFDTIGTSADGIILNGENGLDEIEVLAIYGLTFFIVGIVIWVYLFIKNKKPYNPFALKSEWPKMSAAFCEQLGQIFYVFAMAKNPVLAAPMISGYCIFSVVLSRICLKEKLTKSQYTCVITVIVGIILLGISEGLAS